MNINSSTALRRSHSMIELRDLPNSKSTLTSNLNSVKPLSADTILPKSNIKNEINISGDINTLHAQNHQAQIDTVFELMKAGNTNITREMVRNVMDAGGHGNVIQQEMNHRPEVSLIILTLLEPSEITPKLMLDAATLIKSFNAKNTLSDKETLSLLNTSQKNLDKQVNDVLSRMNTDTLSTLAARYQEKYVNPKIVQQLGQYFSDEVINSRPIEHFLVGDLNQKQNEFIASAQKEIGLHGHKNFGDKYQQINNMFRHIEQKIEIISPLKIKMDLSDSAKQPESQSQNATPVRSDAVIDGGKPASTSSVINSHNTTVNHYHHHHYYSSPQSISENISRVTNTEQAADEVDSGRGALSYQSAANLTQAGRQQASPPPEPERDYDDSDFSDIDNTPIHLPRPNYLLQKQAVELTQHTELKFNPESTSEVDYLEDAILTSDNSTRTKSVEISEPDDSTNIAYVEDEHVQIPSEPGIDYEIKTDSGIQQETVQKSMLDMPLHHEEDRSSKVTDKQIDALVTQDDANLDAVANSFLKKFELNKAKIEPNDLKTAFVPRNMYVSTAHKNSEGKWIIGKGNDVTLTERGATTRNQAGKEAYQNALKDKLAGMANSHIGHRNDKNLGQL